VNPTRHGATHAVAELAGATKEYAPGVGITQADLRVHSRSIHALIGLNGAGKTTLMRVLLGMTYLQAGHVRVLGHTNPRSGNAVWAGVGHLVDHPLAYPELTVATCLDIAARLRGLPSRNRAHAVEAAIEEFGLTPYRSVRVGRLSQGNRQRLGLAIALHHHPQFVVLDEPTNALDPGGMITLRQVLSQRAEAGAGILVSPPG